MLCVAMWVREKKQILRLHPLIKVTNNNIILVLLYIISELNENKNKYLNFHVYVINIIKK